MGKKDTDTSVAEIEEIVEEIASGIETAREQFKLAIPEIDKWGQGERMARLKDISLKNGLSLEEYVELERHFGCSQTRGGGAYGDIDPASGSHKGLFDAFVKDIPQESKTLGKMVKALSPDKREAAMALIAKLLGGDDESDAS